MLSDHLFGLQWLIIGITPHIKTVPHKTRKTLESKTCERNRERHRTTSNKYNSGLVTAVLSLRGMESMCVGKGNSCMYSHYLANLI